MIIIIIIRLTRKLTRDSEGTVSVRLERFLLRTLFIFAPIHSSQRTVTTRVHLWFRSLYSLTPIVGDITSDSCACVNATTVVICSIARAREPRDIHKMEILIGRNTTMSSFINRCIHKQIYRNGLCIYHWCRLPIKHSSPPNANA